MRGLAGMRGYPRVEIGGGAIAIEGRRHFGDPYGHDSCLSGALPAKRGRAGCALVAGSDIPLDLTAATSLLLVTQLCSYAPNFLRA